MSHPIRFAALVVLAAVSGCASRPANQPKITAPDIDVVQEVGPAEMGYPVGPIELQYALEITNHWTEPITVTRIQINPVNTGGAYALRHDFYNVRGTIPPGATRTVSFWAKGYSYGRGITDTAPVSFRAVVHFDTPAGSYQRIIMRELPQPPG